LKPVKGRFMFYVGCPLGCKSGKSLALTGESGSGKSTLLYLIGGLDAPDCGQIKILGRDIAHFDDPQRAALRRGTVGVVFQQFNLIPSLNVAANLSFPCALIWIRRQVVDDAFGKVSGACAAVRSIS
jgi:putative ABC transport system ATP-binding protein